MTRPSGLVITKFKGKSVRLDLTSQLELSLEKVETELFSSEVLAKKNENNSLKTISVGLCSISNNFESHIYLPLLSSLLPSNPLHRRAMRNKD